MYVYEEFGRNINVWLLLLFVKKLSMNDAGTAVGNVSINYFHKVNVVSQVSA